MMDRPESPPPARVVCLACGLKVIPGRFCAQCGLTLPMEGRGTVRCTSCGALLAEGARYCTDCGNPAV